MNRKAGVVRTLLGFLVFSIASYAYTGDWRVPDDSDVVGYWAMSGGTTPPIRAKGDFDGDGSPDEASIVFSTSEDGWHLLVLMNGSVNEIRLFTSNLEDATSYGIELVPTGTYATACGKGYWDCAAGEPEFLTLATPAIRFFRFESASRIFYWDAQADKFMDVWESD